MQLYNTVKRTQKTCRINRAANLYIWSQHFDSLLRKTLRYTFSWCAMMPFNGKISLPKVKSHPLWAASTSHCDRLRPSMTSIGLFFKIKVDVHYMDWREKKRMNEWKYCRQSCQDTELTSPSGPGNNYRLLWQSLGDNRQRNGFSMNRFRSRGVLRGSKHSENANKGEVGQGRGMKAKAWGPASQSGT